MPLRVPGGWLATGLGVPAGGVVGWRSGVAVTVGLGVTGDVVGVAVAEGDGGAGEGEGLAEAVGGSGVCVLVAGTVPEDVAGAVEVAVLLSEQPEATARKPRKTGPRSHLLTTVVVPSPARSPPGLERGARPGRAANGGSSLATPLVRCKTAAGSRTQYERVGDESELLLT